jgi:hypothetical protein
MSKSDLVAQQCAARIISLAFVNLVTPKGGAKHELWFNKQTLEVGLLTIYVRLKERNNV